MLPLTSRHRLTISDHLASHIQTETVLIEDEQIAKYDVLEIKRLMRVTSMFPVKSRWRLLEKNDTSQDIRSGVSFECMDVTAHFLNTWPVTPIMAGRVSLEQRSFKRRSP